MTKKEFPFRTGDRVTYKDIPGLLVRIKPCRVHHAPGLIVTLYNEEHKTSIDVFVLHPNQLELYWKLQ